MGMKHKLYQMHASIIFHKDVRPVTTVPEGSTVEDLCYKDIPLQWVPLKMFLYVCNIFPKSFKTRITVIK